MSGISLQDSLIARNNLTKTEENYISSLYHQTYTSLKKKMATMSHDGSVSESLQKTYLNKLTKQLKEAYQSTGDGLEKEIEKAMSGASSEVIDNMVGEMAKLGLKIDGAYSHVSQDVVSMLATGNVYSKDWSLSKAIWGDSEKKIQDINYIVAQGAAANKSTYEIAKDLEKYVNPSAKKDWSWSKVYPRSSKKVDYNAQRLARTLVSHAYQQSLMATTRYNPMIKGIKWKSAHSSRTCPLCLAREADDSYGLGAGVYPKDALPMDHPNGLCTFLTVTPSTDEMVDRLANWANGGTDPELDLWCDKLGGLSETQMAFNGLQDEWLGKYGYTPENLPTTFSEWSHKVDGSSLNSFMTENGFWDKPHPYQELQKWYENNLLKVQSTGKPKVIPKSPVAKKMSKKKMKTLPDNVPSGNIPPRESWIERMKSTQSVEKSLATEDKLGKILSQEEHDGLRTYTGGSYRVMNDYLRAIAQGVSEEDAARMIPSEKLTAVKNCKKAFEKLRLDEDMILRRGSSIGDLAGLMPGDYGANKDLLRIKSANELNHMLSGSIVNYSSFTSTSSVWEKGFSGSVETVFYAPKGTKASSIMSISRFGSGEGETLLAPGTKARVIAIEESDHHMGSHIRVFMEIIP